MPAAQTIPALRGNPADLNINVIGEGAAGPFTVLGIGVRDKIIKVLKIAFVLTEATPNTVAIATTDITATCTITAADTINTGASSLVDAFAIVVWYKHPRGGQ